MPSESGMSTCAPHRRSSSVTALSPRVAAACKGVRLCHPLLLTFTSAPALSRILTAASPPLPLAQCKAVKPWAVRASLLAPSSRSTRTTLSRPLPHAICRLARPSKVASGFAPACISRRTTDAGALMMARCRGTRPFSSRSRTTYLQQAQEAIQYYCQPEQEGVS